MAVSFTDYLNSYRLTMAARMLASSSDSIANIAAETGSAPHAEEADSSIIWEIFSSVRRVGDSVNVSIAAEADSKYDPLCRGRRTLFFRLGHPISSMKRCERSGYLRGSIRSCPNSLLVGNGRNGAPNRTVEINPTFPYCGSKGIRSNSARMAEPFRQKRRMVVAESGTPLPFY